MTPQIEVVEPSLFVSAVDRSLVHLKSSHSTARLRHTRTTTNSSKEQEERDATSQKKEAAKLGVRSQKFQDLADVFQE